MPDAKDDAPPGFDYMEIAQLRFLVGKRHPNANVHAEKLMALFKSKGMVRLYKTMCDENLLKMDVDLLASMEKSNECELERLNSALQDAEKNEGETEICEAFLARANFYMRIGEKDVALAAFDETYEKTVAVGPKLDVLLSKLRIGMFFEDANLVKSNLEKAKALLEQGGDWERRNRLKVYEAVFLLSIRDFKSASKLFLDSIATFTATELLSYNHFIMYTVLAAMVALPRAELASKVIQAPEILQVMGQIPHLSGLLNGLYECQYKTLFQSLVDITDGTLKSDRFFHQHVRYYWREIRLIAYTQFLESYRSVGMESMASIFGVSSQFLDAELSGFICTQRLSCSIDKVARVVSSTRPDSKNAQYMDTIKQGDLLLNRVQKLSRVINL